MPHFTPEDGLRDARTLFEFCKTQEPYMADAEDVRLERMAMQLAIKLAGDDYVKVAEGCGWTPDDLEACRVRWQAVPLGKD